MLRKILNCALVKKMELRSIAKVMDTILTNMADASKEFSQLTPPKDLGEIKIDFIENQLLETEASLAQYTHIAYGWAESSWNAWKNHHKTIKEIYDEYS